MKKHTIGYKEQIKEMGRESDSIITFGETVLGSAELNAVTPSFQSGLLKSAMKQLDVDSNVEIPVGTILNYKFGTKVNGEYEYIDYGNYVVKEVEKQEDTLSYKITCYDKMLYSMKDYVDFDVEYPISVREYINSLCEYLGLKFANVNDKFVNYDKEIANELYLDENGNSLGYTFRDVFDELAQVTASTICINNNDEVEIRYIKDAINSSVKKGIKIETNDSMDYPVLNYKQYGYTKQNVYNGNNLLNVPSEYSVTGYNIVPINIPANTQFTISAESISLGGSDGALVSFKDSNGATLGLNEYLSSTNLSATRTLTSDVASIYIYSQGNYASSTSVTSTFKKLMVEYGNKRTGYEPYVGGKASPRPDMPQEIEVGRGKNLLNPVEESKTLNGITFTNNGDGSFTARGTSTSAISFGLTNLSKYPINLKKGEYYTQSLIVLSGTMGGSVVNAVENTNGDITYNYLTCSGTTLKHTRQATEDYTIYSYTHYIPGGTTLDVTYKVQLEKGAIVTSYLPYNTIESKSTGKNLWNNSQVSNISDYIIKNETGFKIFKTNNGRLSPPYNLSLDVGNYKILGDFSTNRSSGSNGLLAYSINDDGTNTYFTLVKDRTFNVPKKFSKIVFYMQATEENGTYVEVGDFMITSDNDATEFEPYEESSLHYNLGDNFLADKDYIENGVLNKKVRKYVFTGEETFATSGSSYTFKKSYLTNPDLPVYDTTNYECSHFKKHGNANEIGRMYVGNNNLNFNYDNLVGGVDAFKTYLAEQYANGTPMEFYYLTTDTEQIPLETTGELRTFKPNTIITNDLDSDMEVEYGNSFDTIDEEYFKDINVNFGEKYGPINSVVLSRASESDNIYLRDEESVEKNGLCELKIKENQIMNFNNRDEFLQGIFEKLNGTEYHLNDFASTGITYYDICDRYKINIGDKIYSCVMFNDEILVTQGLEENVFTEMPEESETDYTKADKTDRKINQTYIIADKQNQRIEALTSTVSTLNTTTNNNYQEIISKFEDYTPTSQTIQLEQSVTQLQTDTYTKTEINTKLTDGSVTKVRTTSGTFDEEGMHYEKTGAPTKSTINEAGVSVNSSSSDEELLFAGYDKDINQTIVRTENLTIRRYLVVGENTRIENYTDEDGNVGGGLFIL